VNVLALDLATTMGWAFGPVASTKPICGSVNLKTGLGGDGVIGANFLKWFDAFTRGVEIDALFIEREMQLGAKAMNHEATKRLMGLVFMAESVGELRGFQKIGLVYAQSARKHFVGQARFQNEIDPRTGLTMKSRDVGKEAVMRRCRMLGINAQDHNAADAAALWMYGASTMNPRLAHASTPLFGGRA